MIFFHKLLFSLLLTCFLIANSLPSWAQTQQELNQKAYQRYQQADQELNEIWQTLMKRQISSRMRKRIVETQLTWLNFRDAEAETHAAFFEGGSLAPLVKNDSLAETTLARTRQLKVWLEMYSR